MPHLKATYLAPIDSSSMTAAPVEAFLADVASPKITKIRTSTRTRLGATNKECHRGPGCRSQIRVHTTPNILGTPCPHLCALSSSMSHSISGSAPVTRPIRGNQQRRRPRTCVSQLVSSRYDPKRVRNNASALVRRLVMDVAVLQGLHITKHILYSTQGYQHKKDRGPRCRAQCPIPCNMGTPK